MNRPLTKRFLSLFAPKHSQAYYNLLLQDPDGQFGRTFTYFYDLFGTRDEREIELNRDNMKAPWNPQSGFQVLKVWFMYTITFAAFASQIIPPTDVLNMFIDFILATGIFQLEYNKWHVLPAGEHTHLNALDWWQKRLLL